MRATLTAAGSPDHEFPRSDVGVQPRCERRELGALMPQKPAGAAPRAPRANRPVVRNADFVSSLGFQFDATPAVAIHLQLDPVRTSSPNTLWSTTRSRSRFSGFHKCGPMNIAAPFSKMTGRPPHRAIAGHSVISSSKTSMRRWFGQKYAQRGGSIGSLSRLGGVIKGLANEMGSMS